MKLNLSIFFCVIFVMNWVFAQSRSRPSSAGSSRSFSGSRSGSSGSLNTINNEIYAPRAGSMSLGLFYLPVTGNSTTQAGVKTSYSGYNAVIEGAHAFSDLAVLYVQSTYTDLKTNTDSIPASQTKSIGPGNYKLGLKGLSKSGTGFFHYGVSLSKAYTSPIKTETTNGESSPGSIRPELNATVAFGGSMGPILAGAQLGYSMYQSGNTESFTSGLLTSSTQHASGSGMQWKIFLQTNTAWRWGLGYEQITVDSYSTDTAGIAGTVAKDTTTSPSLYLVGPMWSSSELSLAVYKVDKPETTNSYNLYVGQLGLLIGF